MGICPAPSCLIERESEMDSCGAESATRRVVWDERGVVWTKRRRRRFPRAGIWALSAGLALLGCARPASGGTPSFLDPTPDIGSVTERVGYVGVPITYSMKATAVGSQNLQIMWNAQDEYRPQILLDDDPGAPNLLTVSAIRHTETLFLNQANESTKAPIFFSEIDFEWTPHCAQAKDYRVYFSAKNFDGSEQKRFQLRIVPPTPVLEAFDDSPRIARVGCPFTIDAVARDNATEIGAMGLDKYLHSFTHSVTRFDIRGGSRPMPHVPQAIFSEVFGKNSWNGTTARLAWTPRRGQEGATYQVCIQMQDSCRSVPPLEACLNITIVKCQLCLIDGQTLQSVAAEYDTDYLSLYSTNVALSNPDALPMGTLVNLGVLYRVQEEDSLHALQGRFLSSVEHMLSLNPDIRDDAGAEALVEGDRICIAPPLCAVQCDAGTQCRRVETPQLGISTL